MRHAKELKEADFLETVRAYFLWHINIPEGGDGCWEWRPDDKHHNGYAVFRLGPRSFRAHRASVVLLKGQEIPAGMTVHHHCNNRRCVNPDHLEIMTMAENTFAESSMATARLNAEKTHCPMGHEYTLENTRIRKLGGQRKTDERVCRECSRIRKKKARARARAKTPAG